MVSSIKRYSAADDIIIDKSQDNPQDEEFTEPTKPTEPTRPANTKILDEVEKEIIPLPQSEQPKGELKVHFIDVGQADCI